MFGYIFHTGFVFVTVHALWWVLIFVIKRILGPEREAQAVKIERGLKPLSLLLAIVVAAVDAQVYIAKEDASWALYGYGAIGTFLVYAYLQTKLRKKALNFVMVNGRIQARPSEQSTLEKLTIYGLTVLFAVMVAVPKMLDFQFLRSLLKVILDLLETPVIGWVLKIVGFFYLLWMLLVGALSLRKQPEAANKSRKEDEFDDYEIVEDDTDLQSDDEFDDDAKFLSE